MSQSERQRASEAARTVMAADPLFLDTETTGLGEDAEVCELAVVTAQGKLRLQALVRPMRPIPAEATKIHHITNDMVANAVTFARLLPQLDALLENRRVVIYNEEYDVRVIDQSARIANESLGTDVQRRFQRPICAMKLFARWHGDWNEDHQDYRWQRLEKAAQICGLPVLGDLHRARADAALTAGVMRHMADWQGDGAQ